MRDTFIRTLAACAAARSDVLLITADLGFGVFQSIVEYLVLGAMVVIPIWFIARLVKTARRPDGQPDKTS